MGNKIDISKISKHYNIIFSQPPASFHQRSHLSQDQNCEMEPELIKVPMEGQGLRIKNYCVFLMVVESQELNPVSLEAFPSEVHPQSEITIHKCNILRTIQSSNHLKFIAVIGAN